MNKTMEIALAVQKDRESNPTTTGEQDNKSLVALDLWVERNAQWSQRVPREVLEGLVFALDASHNAALAAERQKVHTLVAAMTKIAEGAGETLHGYEPADIAKDALAKVGK